MREHIASVAVSLVLFSGAPALAQAPAAGAPDPGVQPNRMIDRDEVRVSRVEVAAGATRRVHAHDDVAYHLWIPVEGTFEITIGSDAPVAAAPGQAFFLKRGTPHGFTNIGRTPGAVLEIFVKEPATAGDDALVFDSSTRGPSGSPLPGPKFRVVPTRGLSRPYALAFLPDGRILVTERAGQLRIVKDGVLDPVPVSGMPAVRDRNLKGLNDLALHPRFAENGWVYFTYYKPEPGSAEGARAVLARGRFDGGHALTDVRDLFTTATVVTGPSAARFIFGRDGLIYLAVGIPIPARATPGIATVTDAQDPGSQFGKILRLTDEGRPAPGNPFEGRAGYLPEIYALGIRNSMGLAWHPETGELWETENGPQGGDEINIIKAGANYGWPVVSLGRSYSGVATGDSGPISSELDVPGMEQPFLFWAPSISLTGLAFYTGDRFPAWRDSAFVGGLIGTQLQRVVFNQRGLPSRRYPLLFELKQRIMDVKQGPDGLMYLTTDEQDGAILKLEPVN